MYRFFITFPIPVDINHTNDVDVNNALACPMPASLRPKNIASVLKVTVVILKGHGLLLFFVMQHFFFSFFHKGSRFMALSNTFRIDHDRVGFIFNVFLTKTTLTTHLLYIFLKYMTSFWSLILFFFIDGFFIFRLESVFFIFRLETPMAKTARVPAP